MGSVTEGPPWESRVLPSLRAGLDLAGEIRDVLPGQVVVEPRSAGCIGICRARG